MLSIKPSTRKCKHQFHITFPDGTKIEGHAHTLTACLAIQKIGVEKVANFANRTTKKRHNFPYVSKIAYNIPGNYPYVMVDGYYVIKTIHAPNWVKFFDALNEDLKLGLKVYYN